MTVGQLETIAAAEAESAVVIALHGRGSHPRDMAGMARAIALPSPRWILPAAPIPVGGGFTWYSRPYTDRSPQNRAEFQQARDMLTDLFRKIRAESDGKPIAFLGFSQGGVLSLDLALRGTDSISAAVVLSGGLFEPETLSAEISDSARGTPIFWAHGIYDSILPIEEARAQAGILRENGIDLTFREYPLDHSISAEVIKDARAFLLRALV